MPMFDRDKVSFTPPPPQVIYNDVHHHHTTGISVEQWDALVGDYNKVASTSVERRAINAGLRACLREALKALRHFNPNHSLLDKAYRQKLFNAYEKQEQARIKDLYTAKEVPPVFDQKPSEHIIENIDG